MTGQATLLSTAPELGYTVSGNLTNDTSLSSEPRTSQRNLLGISSLFTQSQLALALTLVKSKPRELSVTGKSPCTRLSAFSDDLEHTVSN